MWWSIGITGLWIQTSVSEGARTRTVPRPYYTVPSGIAQTRAMVSMHDNILYLCHFSPNSKMVHWSIRFLSCVKFHRLRANIFPTYAPKTKSEHISNLRSKSMKIHYTDFNLGRDVFPVNSDDLDLSPYRWCPVMFKIVVFNNLCVTIVELVMLSFSFWSPLIPGLNPTRGTPDIFLSPILTSWEIWLLAKLMRKITNT